MATFLYDSGLIDLTSGAPSAGAPWVSNTYKLTLLTSTYAASLGDRYASAFSGQELSTLSFNAGYGGLMRLTISGRVVSYNTTSHQIEFFGSAVTWSGISAGSAGAAVLLRESGSDALSPLIAYYPLTNIVLNGGDFTLSAPASGYIKASAA